MKSFLMLKIRKLLKMAVIYVIEIKMFPSGHASILDRELVDMESM